MKYLVHRPLVPLAEVSRTLVIPESTLRDWIRKGKIVVESAARSYRKSALNLVDLNSLANELGRDTEELAEELTKMDVKIYIRTLTQSELEEMDDHSLQEAAEPEGIYEGDDSLGLELRLLYHELRRIDPAVASLGEVTVESISRYLDIEPQRLLIELERERHRRRRFVERLLGRGR